MKEKDTKTLKVLLYILVALEAIDLIITLVQKFA